MTDDTWTCPECRKGYDYYECSKRRDPRSSLFRTICGDCFERIVAEPSADQFNVSRNFRKAGPSHQAAQKAEQSAKLNDTHRKIYHALREKPMTADDVAESLGLVLNTARARISDLTNAGWIYDTGERGETAAGHPATVWAITQQQGEAA